MFYMIYVQYMHVHVLYTVLIFMYIDIFTCDAFLFRSARRPSAQECVERLSTIEKPRHKLHLGDAEPQAHKSYPPVYISDI